MTPPVDWWLVLFPEGIDWKSCDREPVYGMIGQVFPPHHSRIPGMKLRTYCLATAIGRVIGASHWARIAKLDRLTAAQAVNQVVVPNGNEELQKIADMAHG